MILSFNNPYPHPITISFHPCLDTTLLKESGFKNFAKVIIECFNSIKCFV